MKLHSMVSALAAAASMAASHAAPLAPQVLRTIHSAKQSVVVAAYSFTSEPVAQALLELHKKGVKVAVLVDWGRRPSNIRLHAS